MINNLTIIVLGLISQAVLLPIPAGAVQSCKGDIRATSMDSSFTLNDDGTATDNTTGLMWMRCSLGQEWNGETCNLKAVTFTWADGLRAAHGYKFAGHNDWRLPNKNELGSILEGRCYFPAINNSVFPATPTAYYWSSSPYAGLANAAWSIDFSFGTINASVKTGAFHIRLVRDVE